MESTHPWEQFRFRVSGPSDVGYVNAKHNIKLVFHYDIAFREFISTLMTYLLFVSAQVISTDKFLLI